MEINWKDTKDIEDSPELPAASDYIRKFFNEVWLGDIYTEFRQQWRPLVEDPEPVARVIGRTAAWCSARIRFPELNKEFEELIITAN